MSLLTTGRSEEKEVDVALGEVACSRIEGPPFLCKVRAKAKVQLLKPKWSEEKEVDVALEAVCSKKERPHSLCKVRATSQCATSPMTGEVLSLASCYNRDATSKLDVRKKKEVDVVLGEVACSKLKDHLFFVKFVLQTTVQLLQV